jgi:ribose transport system ATP-binding protein
MRAEKGPLLLSVRRLSKSFPGQKALDDVSLDLHSGEIVAVVGQNGSGKSTLVKVLTGIHPADPGSDISVHDLAGRKEAARAAHAGIHVIHQDLGLIPTLSTVENLSLGRRPGRQGLGPTRGRAERQHARQLINRFGGDFDVRARIESLTPAERAIVAIGRALDQWERPEQILLLDEPTAALHGTEVGLLFTAVRRAAAAGAGVLFISHRLDEVLGLADRVVALRGGRVTADVPSANLDRAALIELIVGQPVAKAANRNGRRRGEVALSLRDVTGAGVSRVNLDLRGGEIVGVCGILGSGRERLAEVIFGARPLTAGRITAAGRQLKGGSAREAITNRIGFVPADRHADGAVMTMSARENLTLPGLRTLRSRAGNLRVGAERRDTRAWAEKVELDPLQPERALELFSGGNQQKVVLAKWLRNRPAVLLLDEPTQGVDVGAKAAIYALIEDAAADGAAVLVSSSDTAELAALCDSVVVFRDGVIATRLDRADVSEARLVTESLAQDQRSSPVAATTPASSAGGADHGK